MEGQASTSGEASRAEAAAHTSGEASRTEAATQGTRQQDATDEVMGLRRQIEDLQRMLSGVNLQPV